MKDQKHEDSKISKLADLKRLIGHIINDVSEREFPQYITFNRGIEFPKYRITIEELEEDFFIDTKGSKWVKVKDNG